MSLENLAAQAASTEAAAVLESTDNMAMGGSPAEPVAPAITNAQAFSGAIGAAREAFCYFTKLQSPRVVLTEDKVAQLGALWGPVFDKHGINLGEMMGDYMLEFTAVVGTISIVGELRAAVQAELATRNEKPKAEEPGSTSGEEHF